MPFGRRALIALVQQGGVGRQIVNDTKLLKPLADLDRTLTCPAPLQQRFNRDAAEINAGNVIQLLQQ